MGRKRTTETPRDEVTGDTVRIWLVERTYASDEQNIILVYATPDGKRYLRKNRTQRVLAEPTTAALDVSPDRLESVAELDRREQYAEEASRMVGRHDPNDEV